MSKSKHLTLANITAEDLVNDEIIKNLASVIVRDIQRKINAGIYPPKKQSPAATEQKKIS